MRGAECFPSIAILLDKIFLPIAVVPNMVSVGSWHPLTSFWVPSVLESGPGLMRLLPSKGSDWSLEI